MKKIILSFVCSVPLFAQAAVWDQICTQNPTSAGSPKWNPVLQSGSSSPGNPHWHQLLTANTYPDGKCPYTPGCTTTSQACASVAGQYGIPSSDTGGTATLHDCSGTISYNGGCTYVAQYVPPPVAHYTPPVVPYAPPYTPPPVTHYTPPVTHYTPPVTHVTHYVPPVCCSPPVTHVTHYTPPTTTVMSYKGALAGNRTLNRQAVGVHTTCTTTTANIGGRLWRRRVCTTS